MLKGFYDVALRKVESFRESSGLEVSPWYKNNDCPVDILQGHWEFPALLSIYTNHIASLHHQPRIVEIGTMSGGTLWNWIEYAPEDSVVVTVDLPVSKDNPKYQEQKDGQEFKWQQWADKKRIQLEVIVGDSHSPFVYEKVRKDGPIDFLFIDGDHSYEGVKKDFCDYGPLVRAGGLIVFHDILPSVYWGSTEVYRLWNEIKEAGYITQELYASRNQLYPVGGAALGIGIVYKVQDFLL